MSTVIVRHDWPQMEQGTLDERGDDQLPAMSTYMLRVNASTSGE